MALSWFSVLISFINLLSVPEDEQPTRSRNRNNAVTIFFKKILLLLSLIVALIYCTNVTQCASNPFSR